MINMRSIRGLLIAAHLVILSGYSIGLFYVHHTGQSNPAGIDARLNGSEDGNDLAFPMEISTLIVTTHNHMINLGILFALLSVVYIRLNRYKSRFMRHLYLELFVSVFLTFASLWGVRFIHPAFMYLVFFSGVLMHTTFYFIALTNVYHLIFTLDGDAGTGSGTRR